MVVSLQVATELLSPTLAPACQELSDLPKAIIDAAGGHSDNAVEVDDLLELVLGAWMAQQAADQRQLETLFKLVDVKGRGLILQDELVALLKQVRGLGLLSHTQQSWDSWGIFRWHVADIVAASWVV